MLYRAWHEGDPFQAAILDMKMIGMDGAALAQKAKTFATRQNIRELRRGIVRILLAEDDITKPVLLHLLTEALDKWLPKEL